MKETQPETLIDKKTFYIIYIATFLNAFHFAIPLYIESSYIKQVFSELVVNPDRYIGFAYAAAYLITFVLFLNIAKILRKLSNFKLAFIFILIEIFSLLGLAFVQDPFWNIVLFIIHLIAVGIIFFTLDLFLESFSNDNDTGSIRGVFLTILSTGTLIAPFIAGLILTDGDFWKLFLASAMLILPVLLFLYIRFRDFKDPEYDSVTFLEGVREIWARKNIRNIMYANFLLRFFYAWMVVYTPIYLNQYMGIDFSVIVGIIMPIALLPFILFEFALGKIADTRLGEKELLIAGFLIGAASVAIIPFVSTGHALVWAGVLFLTRIGAAFIESMSETYFFKKIDASDAHLIGYFRNLRPLAYIFGPLLASFFLFFVPFQYIFLALSAILLTGIIAAMGIKDTL